MKEEWGLGDFELRSFPKSFDCKLRNDNCVYGACQDIASGDLAKVRSDLAKDRSKKKKVRRGETFADIRRVDKANKVHMMMK